MNVLLTGSRGFIGSHVKQHLLESGHMVIEPDGDLRNGVVLPEFGEMLSEPMGDPRFFSYDTVDYIIDLASRAEVSESLEDPYEFIMDNTGMTLRVLEYARLAKLKRMIHVSSAEVYGPGTHGLHDPHRPTNPYGASKGMQDTVCRAYRNTFDVPVSLAITQNVWGEGQPDRKFYPQIKKRIEAGEEVSVVPGIRRFIEVKELAKRIVDLLEKPVGDYHLAGDLMTNLEFAQMIARNQRKQLNYKEIDVDRPGHEYEYILKS